MTAPDSAEDPMRERILRATFKVLSRHGYKKLHLSDVALHADISRPTLYKFFASKEDLLSAFSRFELQLLRSDLERATTDSCGHDRVRALLGFLADFYRSYQMRGLIEIEPHLVLEQMANSLPLLVDLVVPVLASEVSEPELVAQALVRLSLCHYLVPGYDDDRMPDQLEVAAGVR